MKRVVLLLLMLILLPSTAAAQGPLVEPPPDIAPPMPPTRGTALDLIETHVEVVVGGPIATTRVRQLFRNPSEWALEGEYLFPLPPDAAIQDMDMTVDGNKLEGELMSADQAREIYEEIVRRRLDPALLEWLGSGLFRTRIFPIPPGETRLIELEYTQLLTPQNGLYGYRFPLRQIGATAPVANASVSITIDAEAPLRALYSPSHDVGVDRRGEFGADVGWEGRHVSLDEDFSLFWSVSPEAIELSLLSYKSAGEDGFFLLLAAPTIEATDRIVERDVVVVLDVSGSMEGDKLEQARGALDYVLGRLNERDRFNIIAFSTGTRPFAQRLQPTSEVPAARRWLQELTAAGSTNIDRALQEALTLPRDGERPLMVIFLTDGLPTAGLTLPERIVSEAQALAGPDTRLFTFGVGFDVDTVLLDRLAAQLGGAAHYVTPDERIDEEVSAFYETVSAPVLNRPTLDWGTARVEEIYPSPLPDLFAGRQLVVAGRYREAGPLSITLEGEVNGEMQRFVYDDLRLSGDDESRESWLPRLWATRKVGALLQQIRVNGESREAVEEIVDLGLRYTIVTPYTTFLVDEGDDIFAPADSEQLSRQTAPSASGEAAVEEAEMAADMAASERVGAPVPAQGSEGAPLLRAVGAKSFVWQDGRWMDTQAQPGSDAIQVPFASPDYFNLALRSPDVARYLSLGTPMVLVLEGRHYEITAADETPVVTPFPTPETPPTPTLEPAISTPGVDETPALDRLPVPDRDPADNETPSRRSGLLMAVLLAAAAAMALGSLLLLRR